MGKPAIVTRKRFILTENQPCRCLWRGSLLQITRTTPLRLITLQLRQIRFTDACTFMFASFAETADLRVVRAATMATRCPAVYFALNTMRPRVKS
jgi:hypothetical protein